MRARYGELLDAGSATLRMVETPRGSCWLQLRPERSAGAPVEAHWAGPNGINLCVGDRSLAVEHYDRSRTKNLQAALDTIDAVVGGELTEYRDPARRDACILVFHPAQRPPSSVGYSVWGVRERTWRAWPVVEYEPYR